jgi:hypothetical protein
MGDYGGAGLVRALLTGLDVPGKAANTVSSVHECLSQC